MADKTPNEMIEKLEDAARLEGAEVGDQWQSLSAAETAASYGSHEFKAAWEKEVREQYEHFTTNFRIVTRKETREVEYTDLEFIG